MDVECESTVGRPRRVTDAQVRIILAWRADVLELQARRKAVKTIQQLARELQLPAATISDVVRKHGYFKQPSPEKREAVIVQRRATLGGARVRRREGHCVDGSSNRCDRALVAGATGTEGVRA